MQLKDLLAIKNEVSCCLIERRRVAERTKPPGAQTSSSNISFMSKLVGAADSDTFAMEQGLISVKTSPVLSTILYPDTIKLPFTVDLEITDAEVWTIPESWSTSDNDRAQFRTKI